MNTFATVKEVNGKYAVVETERRSACDGCHKNTNGEGCAMCKIFGGNAKVSARARNTVGAQVGDKVEIESSSARMLGYAALVFILPLVLAVVSYFLLLPALGEGFAALSAIGAFVLSFFVIAVISKLLLTDRCDIDIVKIIK